MGVQQPVAGFPHRMPIAPFELHGHQQFPASFPPSYPVAPQPLEYFQALPQQFAQMANMLAQQQQSFPVPRFASPNFNGLDRSMGHVPQPPSAFGPTGPYFGPSDTLGGVATFGNLANRHDVVPPIIQHYAMLQPQHQFPMAQLGGLADGLFEQATSNKPQETEGSKIESQPEVSEQRTG